MDLKPISATFPQLEPYREELRVKYSSAIYLINCYAKFTETTDIMYDMAEFQ